ncbi:MAG: hypothetical protein QOH26_159 [Actinomycetota bacterium]|jgi:hypothetical protein|nr:hypothetical protein [Actinomycetota bacterium]
METPRSARGGVLKFWDLIDRNICFTGSASFLLGGNPGVDDEVI